MKTGIIVQARATSSRLPRKVLKTLDFETGATVLDEVLSRLKMVKKADEVIVATTINEADDDIVKTAMNHGVIHFRGSEKDVLERYYLAAKENNLDYIIRITSDCPFIDPEVIDGLIDFYFDGKYDYAGNGLNRTFPHGLDCEIFSMEGLTRAYKVSVDNYYREHVTSYMYSHPEEYKLGSYELKNENFKDIRITVDTKKDYALACVLQSLLKSNENKSFRQIIKLYEKRPYLTMINDDIVQKQKYDSIKAELEQAVKILELQELKNAAEIIKKAKEKL